MGQLPRRRPPRPPDSWTAWQPPSAGASRGEASCSSTEHESFAWVTGNRQRGARVRDLSAFGALVRHGSVGLGQSYIDGSWDSDDLTDLVRVLLHNRGVAGRARDASGRAASVLIDPLLRLRKRPPSADRRERARALRHRQRTVLPDARPDVELLLRIVRAARDDPRGGVPRQAGPDLQEAGSVAGRPRHRDRNGLGRFCGARRDPLRVSGDLDDHLRRAVRLRHRVGSARRLVRSCDHSPRGLSRSPWAIRQARVDRDGRGDRLARARHLLPDVRRARCGRRG